MASKKIGASGPVIPMIESQELAFSITSKKKMLIVDSRSLLEYNNKCILNAINVSCSKLLKRRLQQDKMSVTELLQVENPRQPVSTDPSTPVVVYDQCTELFDNLPTDHFVYILLRKLTNHYRDVSLLKGGIVEFQTHFGSLCERRNLLPLDLAPRASGPLTPDRNPAGVDSVDGYAASQRSPPFLTAMSVPVCNIGPTRILDHLYLGSQTDAMDADVLRANGVTHILNVSNNPKTPHVSDTYFFRIDVNDGYVDKILPHFQKGFMFLEKVRQAGGRALVHCLAGISRSPTLAIAYLMQFMHMSSDDAYRYVKERRANIAPNFNFLGQLLEFERQLRSKRASDSQASTPSGPEYSPLPMAVASAASTPLLAPQLTSPFALSSVRPPTVLPTTTATTTTSSSTSSSSSASTRLPPAIPSSSSSSSSSSRPPCLLSCSRPPSLPSSESGQKKKRPCLNQPSHLPAEKTAKTSSTGPSFGSIGSPPAAKKPPVSPMYECLLGQARQTRAAPPPSSLAFSAHRPVRPSRQARLELPRSATAGQIASPTTALARLSFDNMSQFSAYPTTSLEKLSFMPCHSAMDRGASRPAPEPPAGVENVAGLPRSKSAVENLGRPAARPLWLNFGPPTSTTASTASSTSTNAATAAAVATGAAPGRLRSPLTPRKQLGAMSPVAEPETASRKSRSLEDMLEGLVPAPAGSCLAPEGAGGRRTASRGNGEAPCRLLDHTLHHSSSSLSSSAASGSQHSSMHSSMEILQCS